MTLRWVAAHDGAPVEFGFDGDLRAGQVVFYDVVDGGGPGWVGFVRGWRVSAGFDDVAAARAAVEAVLADDPRFGLSEPPR